MESGAAVNLGAILEDGPAGGYEVGKEVVEIEAREIVAAQFKSIVATTKARIDEISALATTFKVESEEDQAAATALVGEGAKLVKSMKAKGDEIVGPFKTFIDGIRGMVSGPEKKYLAAKQILSDKIVNYGNFLKVERAKQELLAKKEAEKLQKKLDKQAEKAGVSAPVVATPVIPETKTTIKSETGSTSYEVKRWVCTVTDAALVPRQYCEPVKKLLDDAVKLGVREIRGCAIEEITDIRFRA